MERPRKRRRRRGFFLTNRADDFALDVDAPAHGRCENRRKTGFDRPKRHHNFRHLSSTLMRKLLPALAAFAALAPFTRAEDKAPAAPATPAAAEVKSAEPSPENKKLFLQAFGWIVAKRSGLTQLDFNEAEMEEVLAGAKLGATGKGEDFPAKMQALEGEYMAYLQARSAAAQAKETKRKEAAAQGEIDAGKAFIKAAAAADKDIVVEPNGLAYKIIDAGKGDKPKAESVVKVLYTGKTIDGATFDSTADRNNEPAEFQLNQVVKGWTLGIQKVAKGGKIKLWIPGDLAYGVEGREPKIKPGATLVFDVEILDIKAAPAAQPEAVAPPVAPAAK